MHRIPGLFSACLLALPILIAQTGCATRPQRSVPVQFDRAVQELAANLVQQFNQQQLFVGRLRQVNIVSAPFVDAGSGEINAVSRSIEKILFEEFAKRSTAITPLSISRLTPENFAAANYVLIGVFQLESYGSDRRYRLYASMVSRESREIVAHGAAWVANTDLDYTPAPLYDESPMYPRDQRLKSMVAIANSPVGIPADRDYYDSLETNALLIEAESRFDQNDYAGAAGLFQQAAARPDGQVMKTYIGLYRTSMKLNDATGAENAFSKLLAVGVANKEMSAKLLFAVNSTDFIDDPALRAQYAMWLRQIGRYFNASTECLQIAGHSSRTGGSDYNSRLSLARAKRIQELMRADFSGVEARSKALGEGFSRNLVGSGTDDARDALDRRVEFSVTSC